jgi:hypothetical protein
VWVLLVVVGGELFEQGVEVALVHGDHVVEALAPEGAHHPLCDRVRSRSADRCQELLDAEPLERGAEVAPVDAVPIANEEAARAPTPWRR